MTHENFEVAQQQSVLLPYDAVYKIKPNSQHQTKPDVDDPVRGMGKPARYTPTRELLRFEWLLQQLEDRGVTQKQVTELTGIKKAHLNQIKHHERYRKTGVGAEWIGLMTKGLNLDPAYFFDEYDGPADHRLYLLSAKRDEKRVASIESRLGSVESISAALAGRMGSLETENTALRSENKVLRTELQRRKKPTAS